MADNITDEALRQAYMKHLSDTPQRPTRPGFADIYTMAREGAKKSTGQAVLGGITGLLRALGSPEGMKILTAATTNPYMKAAMLRQAAQREKAIQREQETYKSEMAPKMQEIGQYVRERQKAREAADLARREQEQKELEEITLTPEEKYKRETSLRKEVNNQVKDYSKIVNYFQRIKAVTKEPSAAGDLALIFNYMKMLDEDSAVRPSEYESAEGAKAAIARTEEKGILVPAFVKTAIQKIHTGEFLLPEQRQDFITQSRNIYDAKTKLYEQTINYYRNLAEKEALDPERVIVTRGFIPEKTDKFGHSIGETMTRGGKTYKYVGDNKWQEQ
jgi:hypothetical protein